MRSIHAERGGQNALPGVSPLCPHCGSVRETHLVAESETDVAVVDAERWECRSCGGVFWSLPSLRERRTERRR
jgi:uncharacterized protein with PIN domain